MEKNRFLNFLPGIIFSLIVVSIVLKGNEPWKWKEYKKQHEEYCKQIEHIKNDRIYDFLNNCDVIYAKASENNQELDLNELADIIKEAVPTKKMVNRDKLKLQVDFINRTDDYRIELEVRITRNKPFVLIYISRGIPSAGSHKYTSKQMTEWTEKNFPEVFEEIREYNRNMEKW